LTLHVAHAIGHQLAIPHELPPAIVANVSLQIRMLGGQGTGNPFRKNQMVAPRKRTMGDFPTHRFDHWAICISTAGIQ
jgi:hypothetical protein